MTKVVVTGIGVIAPNGLTTDSFWNNCLQGIAPVSNIPEHWHNYSHYSSSIYAPLPPPSYDTSFVNRIELMQIDKVTLLAQLAAKQALDMGSLNLEQVDEKKNTWQLSDVDSYRCGVFVGTGMGGITSFAGAQGNHIFSAVKSCKDVPYSTPPLSDLIRMPPRFNPFIVSMVMPNATAASVGIKFSIKGRNRTYCQACAAGAFAIGDAFRAIQSGQLDFALAGGAEYLADEYGGIMRGFDTAKTLAKNVTDPSLANRPFDKDRTGFLFAEGGSSMLLLESADHAARRGAKPLAEICAFGESFDAFSMMAVDSKGTSIRRMINEVLRDAEITNNDINYINAHATGTELNDEVEAQLIDEFFGGRPIVNATKSLIGHTIGAAGAIEAAVTILSLHNQTTHICKNLDNPIRDLNFVSKVEPCSINYGLSQSFAFGGHNAALLFKVV